MSRIQFLVAIISCTALIYSVKVVAQPQEIADAPAIEHLLKFVRLSGCQFKRNGSWHDSESAADHIQRKFDYVKDRGGIQRAEDFIRYAASESSWTGIDYVVKCPEQSEQTSADWLLSELARYRSTR